MKIVFIDYSEIYYRGIAKRAVPEKLSGKFIQIRNNATEYLIFSPKEFTPYHTNIVEWFCLERGVKGSYDRTGKRFNVHDPKWIVVGGGKFEINTAEKSIRLFDNSMAYGRFDSKGLKGKILSIDSLSDYSVRIE